MCILNIRNFGAICEENFVNYYNDKSLCLDVSHTTTLRLNRVHHRRQKNTKRKYQLY